jgi:hypothetical protein
MSRRARFIGFLLSGVLAAACREPLGPAARAPAGALRPAFAKVAAPLAPGSSAITLDQLNGTLSETNNLYRKGFNPTNPHNGDAIVATVFWLGSGPNVVDSVVDVMTMPNFPRVGNKYRLVDFVSAGGISMATYVATNVQGFPDGYNDPSQDSILAVEADLSQVVSGGILISAWSGVDAVTTQAVGSHSSASGSGSAPITADPGTVPVGAGALAYGVTLSNAMVGADAPAGFTTLAVQSNSSFSMVDESNYLVSPNVGTVDPHWFWYFNQPSTWLASVATLNPPPHLSFAVQPSTTLPLMTIQPSVQVAILDALGNRVTGFNGAVTIAIGHNGGTVLPGTLSGTKTVNAVNGVATFADLSIDQPGNGYTLVATVPNVFTAESAPFNIGAF